ncbi:MAG: RNA-binding cell elongation regulator Jag/EloR [Spirochaetota bacterium]|jgi:spoIIIJ-associated protein|nr:RNA-binding cell elongation regulator Jag/EloR [Spirochaetota bacterium]
MIERDFTGKSEDEIISAALDLLKLKREQVEIKVENKGGFLGLGKKEVTVKISYDDELSFANRSLMLVKELLERMDIEAKIYLMEEDDEKVLIDIEAKDDSAILIGKQGKTLEAIQTIVNVIMNKDYSVWTKIIIDTCGYRERRERNLKKIAQDAAKQVKRDKKSILLEPMNPFERRIIHMTLKNVEQIDTISEGEGTIKRVKVLYQEEIVEN